MSALPETSVFDEKSAAPETSFFDEKSATPETSVFDEKSATPETSARSTFTTLPTLERPIQIQLSVDILSDDWRISKN